MSVVYDAGALVAAERSDRAAWAAHRARLELGRAPVITAPVIAQVSRSGRQVQLRRFLRGCEVVSFAAEDAHDVGSLVGRSATADVVESHVVAVAYRRGLGVVTADMDDLRRIADALPGPVLLVAI